MITNELVFTKFVCLVKLFLCLQRNVPFLNLFGIIAYCLILKTDPLIQTKNLRINYYFFYVTPCNECFITYYQ